MFVHALLRMHISLFIVLELQQSFIFSGSATLSTKRLPALTCMNITFYSTRYLSIQIFQNLQWLLVR